MSDGTDDTTIGRGGWALVLASGVISFVVLRFPMHYQLFPSVAFALAIALIVLLILYRLAVAVNRHDDAEGERQVRKIVPASSLAEGATRVRGVEGAQGSTIAAVPVRPEASGLATQRPAASVVTPLSRVEPAPIIAPQPAAARTVAPPPVPTPAAPTPPASEEPVDTFADLPDVWARPGRTPAPVPEPTPVAKAATPPAASDKPKAGFKTKADLAAAAMAPKAKAEPKPKVAAKAVTEPKVKAEPKAEPKPKAEAKPKSKAEAKPVAKAEAKPVPKPEAKPEAKPKAAAKAKPVAKPATKPKAAKPAPAGLVRLSAPRDGVADDLKEIEGIGPAIEKLVNGLGFYHFDQIAAWSDEDVAKVDAELRTFKGRIERDKWVAQARIIVNEGLMAFRERAKTNDY